MTIVNLKGREAPKASRSAMETLLFTREEVEAWLVPPFQRPLRVNDKVRAMSEEMAQDGGIIPGVLTLGVLKGSKTLYIVDGQHRTEAFKLSGLQECIADVRMVTFANMAEMAEEFVNLNSSLVKMRPDDILRGLEGSVPSLKRIRDACDFVGYGQIRRADSKSAVIGMSVLLRCWFASAHETPTSQSGGRNAAMLAHDLDANDCDKLIVFMQIARAAWGTDPEHFRLWGALNLTLTMWLWRQIVLDKERGVKRYVVLNNDQFKKCLMSMSANSEYLDWLVGRAMNDRDRSPCFVRMKAIFTKRLQQDAPTKKIQLPQPAWSSR